MKITNIKLGLILILVLGVFFAACNSDDSNPSGSGNNVNGTMTAKVNGADWTATIVSKAAKAGPTIVITADEVAGGRQKKIQINLMGVSAAGTYSLGGMNSGAYIDVPAGTTDPNVLMQATEMATSGSITISELSTTKIKGTFSMTTDEGTSITNGSFDMKF